MFIEGRLKRKRKKKQLNKKRKYFGVLNKEHYSFLTSQETLKK